MGTLSRRQSSGHSHRFVKRDGDTFEIDGSGNKSLVETSGLFRYIRFRLLRMIWRIVKFVGDRDCGMDDDIDSQVSRTSLSNRTRFFSLISGCLDCDVDSSDVGVSGGC